MSPGQCPCPECGMILRVRDRSFIGRQIECPECHGKLLLKLDGDRHLEAVPFQPEVAAALPPHAASPSQFSERIKRVVETLHSPLVVAWALAIGLTTFVAILLLRPAVRFQTPTAESEPSVVEANSDEKPETTAPLAAPVEPAETVTLPEQTLKQEATVGPPQPQKPTPTIPVENEKPVPAVVAVPPEVPKPTVAAPPKVDVEVLLKQRLSGFATRNPTSRQELIEQIEELAGVPIRFNRQELGEKNLMQAVSISVEVTTVGGILKIVLEAAGWDYVIEENGIRLKQRRATATEPG